MPHHLIRRTLPLLLLALLSLPVYAQDTVTARLAVSEAEPELRSIPGAAAGVAVVEAELRTEDGRYHQSSRRNVWSGEWWNPEFDRVPVEAPVTLTITCEGPGGRARLTSSYRFPKVSRMDRLLAGHEGRRNIGNMGRFRVNSRTCDLEHLRGE